MATVEGRPRIRRSASRRRIMAALATLLTASATAAGLTPLGVAPGAAAALARGSARPSSAAASAHPVAQPATAPRVVAVRESPVLNRRVIGYSVQHRPIIAYHLGNPNLRRTVVLIGQMHGDEPAGVTLADSIIHGSVSVEGVNLWVVPTMNPDGDAAHTRTNAHGVDLNRNWPDDWTRLTGMYNSGPRPLSEPETRAMHAFLERLRPHYVVSLHQPLHGVDTTDGGALDAAFRRALARNLALPQKPFRCWSTCRGSMTGWYTTQRYGIADTVEFGAHPHHSYLVGRAARGILRAMGGRFGRLSAHNPRGAVQVTSSAAGLMTIRGAGYDIDGRKARLAFDLYLDGRLVRSGRAASPSPRLDRRHHLVGSHGFRAQLPAPAAGRHVYCAVFGNYGAGSANTRVCASG